MAQPKCPFCLSTHDFNASHYCTRHDQEPDWEVPQTYLDDYNRVPPLWLMTIGFKQHGKTTYLDALMLLLENLGRAIPGASTLALDEYTRKAIQKIRHDAMVSGQTPDPTPINVPLRPMLLHAYDMPQIGSNALVMYDTPGELFESIQVSQSDDYLQFLKQIRNSWFLISLDDLLSEQQRDKTVKDLLDFYITGMRRLHVPVSGRNLIVVYTKADRLINSPDLQLPDALRDYILDDPFQSLTQINSAEPPVPSQNFNFNEYLMQMQNMSDLLREYTRARVPGGGGFIDLAQRNNLGLYFTMVSALGTDASGGETHAERTRYRVIDPYLWALHLNQPEPPRSVRLILDGGAASEKLYSLPLSSFFEELRGLGEITTYYLGYARPASRTNQSPPSAPPKSFRPRLIGPILNQTPPNTPLLVITTEPILDLDDYQRDWEDKIFLVSVGEEEHQNWANGMAFRSNDSLDLIFTEFRRFLNEQQIH